MSRLALAGVALVAASVVACESAGGSQVPGVHLPVQRERQLASDGALLTGTLLVEDGCVILLTEDGGRYLPLWAFGTLLVAHDDILVVSVGETHVPMGAEVSLGGSEARDLVAVQGDLDQPLPLACGTQPGWLVGDLVAVDGRPVADT